MKRLLLLLLLVSALIVGALLSPIIENPAVLAQVNTFCASNLACTVAGAWTFTNLANLNSVVYIGGGVTQIGGSADIGAQINAAYLAASANGGKAIVLPLTGGGCYSSSVPIVLATGGKYFPIEGTYTANQTGANPQGSCINFTPTTGLATTAASVTTNVATFTFGTSPITFGFLVGEALNITGFTGGDTYFNGVWSISTVTSTQITATQPGFSHANASAATNGAAAHTAVTLDYTVTQGGGFTPHVALKNMIWLNNGVCLTVGGCGSSTVGVAFGPNGGIHSGELQNVSFRGFLTGFSVSNSQAGNVSWSMKFNNVWAAYNATGFSLTNLATSEALKWTGGGFANNGTGFTCGPSITTDVTFDTVSFDVNSTAGVNNAGCVITLASPHFEDGGGGAGSNAYIIQSNGEFIITGGRVMEDKSGGTTAQFFQVTGGSFSINGINASAGQTVTNLLANSGGFGRVSYFTDAPTLVAPGANNEDTSKTCSTAYFCIVERIITNPAFNFQAAQFPVLYLTGPGAGSPAGVGGGFPLGVMYYNGSLNRTNLQDNGVAADNVNGTNNVLTASSTDKVTNKTFTGVTPFPGNTAALTADWTCGTGGTVASCTSATIIGSGGGVPLTFTLPLVAQSYTLTCDGVVGQATAATLNQWNLLTATNGATNVTANYTMATAATAYAAGAVTDQASTTTTFQITPSWTLGGTATKMPFHIWAKIEGASASGTVVSLQLLAPTVGDLVTIFRGSACRIF